VGVLKPFQQSPILLMSLQSLSDPYLSPTRNSGAVERPLAPQSFPNVIGFTRAHAYKLYDCFAGGRLFTRYDRSNQSWGVLG
jgi:hypothetical protein